MLITCTICKQIIPCVARDKDSDTINGALGAIAQHIQKKHPEKQTEHAPKIERILTLASCLAVLESVTITNTKALDEYLDSLLIEIINLSGVLAQRAVNVDLMKPDTAELAKGGE